MMFFVFVLICIDINECRKKSDRCGHLCRNTLGSFECSCNTGYALTSDGISCQVDCGGVLNSSSGSFHTPMWPVKYPMDDFRCKWTINLPNNKTKIEFTIDQSAYGINGRHPCATDYIEFHDGSGSRTKSISKLCQFMNPGPITTTSSTATVVFVGTNRPNRPRSRVGVHVTYKAIVSGTYIYICKY